MAAHGTTEYSVAKGNDYPAHEASYRSFVALFKWGTISTVVLLILMAMFLL